MPNIYLPRTQITFHSPLIVQMRVLGGSQFGNNEPSDAALVRENGIWKYPALASTGRLTIPKAVVGLPPPGAMRLRALTASWGASTTWELHLLGNPPNTTDTPYPAADAALYAEGDVLVDTQTGVANTSRAYGYNGTEVIVLPGQSLYVVTTTANAGMVRFYLDSI